jgi:hypothetical protein
MYPLPSLNSCEFLTEVREINCAILEGPYPERALQKQRDSLLHLEEQSGNTKLRTTKTAAKIPFHGASHKV